MAVQILLSGDNPRWVNPEKTMLDVDILWNGMPEPLSFSAIDGSGEVHTQSVWDRALAGEFGRILDFVANEPKPSVRVLPAVTLWERMTEAEAEQVAEVMATQPFRTRKIFETAATFRSDHELWPLLEQIANQLFGEARATELLDP